MPVALRRRPRVVLVGVARAHGASVAGVGVRRRTDVAPVRVGPAQLGGIGRARRRVGGAALAVDGHRAAVAVWSGEG